MANTPPPRRICQDLARALARYAARFPEEAEAVAVMRTFLECTPAPFSRGNPDGHFTGSAFILDRTRQSILLIHHRRLDRWLQPGGHVDPLEAPFNAARREAIEETGIGALTPIETDGALLDIDSHAIPANPSRNEPAHIHHDLRYGFWGDESSRLAANAAEVRAARWRRLDHDDLDIPARVLKKLRALTDV